MSNTLITPTALTNETLRILHQKLRFINTINKEYDDSFAKSGAKIGDSLKVRKPNQYVVRSGAILDAQDSTETYETITLATQKGVDMKFSSAELTMSIDRFSERYLEPAATVLAAAMEADALNMRKDVWNQVNNTAAAATFATVLQGRRKLEENLTPEGTRTCLLNPNDNASLINDTKTLFNSQPAISGGYKSGVYGNAAGFDFMESTHLSTQERGAGDGAYAVTTTITAAGTTSVVLKTGAGAIKKGEVITIGAVYSVHPESKVSTGILQQFVVTADHTGGAGTITVSPAMYASGAAQNVTAYPQADAAVTIAGTASVNYGQSLAYHKEAFAFVTADLQMPRGVDFSARSVFDGISVRIVRNYDINNDQFPCRLDVYYGYKTLRPQLAVRMANLAPTT